MYLTACKFLVTPVRLNSKKLAPVPCFQETPVRLLSIRTVGGQSEEDSGERGLVFAIFYRCQEKTSEVRES